MLNTARLDDCLEAESRRAHSKHRLRVTLADTLEDVRAAQRLRHEVFVEEMGARVEEAEHGIESDRFDHYCQHLLVRDERSDRVVGCYRILTDSQAQRAGSYYSETEFDLARVRALPGRIMEVGRTCVHPDYRNGAVINLLWSGLTRFMVMHRFDYLIGCASVALHGGLEHIGALWHGLGPGELSPPERRVFPRTPFTMLPRPALGTKVEMPPLIKGYLRVGAQVCGEPAWDPAFNVADLFLLLDIERLGARYARHYLARA
jgi:putative hemolysin